MHGSKSSPQLSLLASTPTSTPGTLKQAPVTRGDGNELAGAQVHGGPSRGYISPPRAVPVASASSSHPQERARTTQSTPESFYARDRPELRRLGRPLISWYSPSLPPILLDLEPPDLTDPFPSFSRSDCSSERANQAPPEALPPASSSPANPCTPATASTSTRTATPP